MKIPLLPTGEAITPTYTHDLEVAIQSDGCTDIPEFHHHCCVVHDLGYRFGIDPYGTKIDRRTADANFRKCMQKDSPLGRFSPMSWWRWAAVRVAGRFFYTNKDK